MLPNINLPDIATGATTTGEMDFAAVEALNKALTAGYGTDSAQFTGATALRIQSLDKTMKATIQENKHFRLFNELAKSSATATVDEWTEMSSVGGFLGGSTNSELGTVASAQGAYARRTAQVKYLMTRREVSLVATLGNNIESIEAVEATNGAKQLLTDAEYLSFAGDSSVVPTEFDGIYSQIVAGVNAGQVDSANVVDGGALPLNSIHYINQIAAQIAGYGNFGTPTDLFCSQLVQSDFDTALDPAFRVPLPDVPGGGISIGSPVKGIRTSWGDIKNQPDVFIPDHLQLQPFEVLFPSIATANASLAPTVAYDATQTDAASQFTSTGGSGQTAVGNYYYLVTGLNASGQSTGVVSAQQVVASGKKVVLTITRSAGAQETGYAIYRSRLNGGNSVAGSVAGQGSDFRLITRVACAGATTTYTDYNRDVPGTTKAFILNMTKGDDAISWRQLLPMTKFLFYPTTTVTIPWAQLLFGYLRITKRKHHGVIKNILPSQQPWRPFNV